MEGTPIGDEKARMESQNHLTSAAAFVEGGIQDACDDACSICLEEFLESDPSTVTSCKHEYHLQCILEWCQRSSLCPMCCQPLSLKDPTSQELLEAVEQERNIRANRARASALFRHPILGDFDLQNLPADDAELEERLIQHLAAAAAMRRTHRNARREGRGRIASNEHPHILIFSAPEGNSGSSAAVNTEISRETHRAPVVVPASPVFPVASNADVARIVARQSNAGSDEQPLDRPINSTAYGNNGASSNNRAALGQSSPILQDRPGPSDLHSFSESLKSRLNAFQARYKESITKSTRSWRERWFSRNSAISDLGTDERNAGLAAVSGMTGHLEIRSGTATPESTSHQDDIDNSSSEGSQNV